MKKYSKMKLRGLTPAILSDSSADPATAGRKQNFGIHPWANTCSVLRRRIILPVLILYLACLNYLTVFAQQYKNQEKIPGASEQTSCFPTYLKQIINFGFATIGILAMFMIAFGAFQYLMAAGNISKADAAKESIASAVGGLILGLCAWVILNTINPDLVSMSLSCN